MKYDRINFTGGSYETCFNLTKSVGFQSDNLFDDVMLIQAMIRLIAISDREVAGLGDSDPWSGKVGFNIPEVTSVMDAVTYTAIVQFQLAHSSELLARAFDGRIDPAHYRGRKLPRGPFPVMTITLLHYLAKNAVWGLGATIAGAPAERVLYQGKLEAMNSRLKTLINDAALADAVEMMRR